VKRSRWVGFLLPLALSSPGLAETVVPSDRVQSRVIVREGPSQRSLDLGGLRPGEEAELLVRRDTWYRVRLSDGSTGYVSARFTRVLGAPEPEPDPDFRLEAELEGRGFSESVLGFLRGSVLRPFRGPPRVDFVIRHPELGRSVRRHYDPRLPVAGFATTPGSDARFDLVLALDTSTSTLEFAEADVDGDSRGDDVWRGRDSILRAQCRAGVNFTRALRRLPGNRDGGRIRVGLVTFAGDESLYRNPEDRDFDAGPIELMRLASRDAELLVPLTSEYARVESALGELAESEPSGMTNFAAGVARALIELEGLGAVGAGSEPRAGSEQGPDVEKVIQFLTDGKPRLPYDRDVAERAARRAASLAADSGIRINTFQLGRNAVTREVNETLERMSRRSGGRFVGLARPADIAHVLDATRFSFVERVKLVNRTTGRESSYIATGIDGSFYGEIGLRQGDNEVELVAALPGGKETSERLRVRFEQIPREERLARELARIREENEALLEQLKKQLAADAHDVASPPPDQTRIIELEVDGVGDGAGFVRPSPGR
jgi:hypothetical protein